MSDLNPAEASEVIDFQGPFYIYALDGHCDWNPFRKWFNTNFGEMRIQVHFQTFSEAVQYILADEDPWEFAICFEGEIYTGSDFYPLVRTCMELCLEKPLEDGRCDNPKCSCGYEF
ncbi:hypothetical protein [Deinococcus cellulosilyticus]|uniref:Uncharacterized protein n=1 Tax=Deinococcus cellulosilyticus (strain DSM 18568 / NBRC 106333 / KACC 11606 / 5516J-15) TaxID=1223518 RepID=A0A511NBI9_DEIC1|nr:hypothetical protein [Deinococcus cellulosilyticus]GEM50153.1 hypothetical protein DC3_57880 [Deinococcus cellulosilyticus NBRC 106333 = KACC 11606]